MKIKRGVLFLLITLSVFALSSCYHRGYLPLPQPDEMVLRYKSGEETTFFPEDETFQKLFEFVSDHLWVTGSTPLFYAGQSEGEEALPWEGEDYLHLIYHRETRVIEPCQDWLQPDQNWQDELVITGIVFTPNMEGEEYYYLETPDGIVTSLFDRSANTGHLDTPYYPPLSELLEKLRTS